MPLETRPIDNLTRQAILLGLPVVEFTPLESGVYGTTVPLGILSAASLEKVVEVLQLVRGDSGTLVVDRELITRFEWNLAIETFSFAPALARYVFGSDTITSVVANAAQAVTNEVVNAPSDSAIVFSSFVSLQHADISEASVVVTFAPIVDEAVGTGNGVLGGTQGDFALNQKINNIADVTEFLVGGVDETANLVAGSTPAAGQIAIETGEQDSLVTGSGAITFGASKIPANGAAIVATYTPSFSGAAIANLTDFTVDPLMGRIRLRKEGADLGPWRLAASAISTSLHVDYTYNRLAHVTINPGAQTQFVGKATIKQLSDVGINFIWPIPSVGLRLTDDALEFSAEDFAVANFILNILSDGTSAPYGVMQFATEDQHS